MTGTARCGCCFRLEDRENDAVLAVRMAGGGRRPPIPGDLAAWRTLRNPGTNGPAVAACPACGQPMFCVDGELPALPRWEIVVADGPIAVGPDGHAIDLDDADADRRAEDHHREALTEKLTNGQVGFALILLAAVTTIGAVVGACECPTMAIALALPMATRAARRR